MSVGIAISDTIVTAVEAGVAVYNEILGDPANDPAIVGNRKDMKRTRRRVPQSLVRRIATTIPMKTDQRIKIPITRFQEEYGISVSSNGKYSVSPFEDTSWLYEEEGNMDSSYRTHRWTQNPYPREAIQRWELKPPRGPRSRAPSGSGPPGPATPADDLDSGLESISVVTVRSEVAEERVAALEQELASLKQMMAAIALQQMPAAASTPAKPAGTPRTPAMVPPPAPPAPPVPAAPPAPTFKASVPPSQKTKKMPEIKEGKQLDVKPNMGNMLRDVGKQKSLLKSVEKSPGGTPVRREPKPCNPNDPSTILANALKQKFANVPLNDSTDKDISFNDSQS